MLADRDPLHQYLGRIALLNNTHLQKEMNFTLDYYTRTKAVIEGNPIKINIDASSMDNMNWELRSQT
jgi:hypothetical protein